MKKMYITGCLEGVTTGGIEQVENTNVIKNGDALFFFLQAMTLILCICSLGYGIRDPKMLNLMYISPNCIMTLLRKGYAICYL